MLLLTRRVGECLIIDDDIKIKILEFKGHQVRIGIDAPKEISVHREEIYDRIQKVKLEQIQEEAKAAKAKLDEVNNDI